MNTIHPSAHIGAVHLTVRDLERSLAYYQDRIGLELLDREGNTARLGVPGRELLVLVGDPAARLTQGTTGLYHFAILTPSRRELARAFSRLVEPRTPMTGASDHGVSEALYLQDPEDNGIEIYRDRERSEWPWKGDQLAMTTEGLDLRNLLGELERPDPEPGKAGGSAGLPAGTTMGHVHLHVADLGPARELYVDTLGLGLTQRYGPSALFVSAGGYHHHIGLNTWQGVGAPPPPADATGLRHFEIVLPNGDEVERLRARLEGAGVAVEERDGGVFVHDPSSNGVLLRT